MARQLIDIADRVEATRARIASVGGDPERVTIIAVTKGFGADAVEAAVRAGLCDVGENYAQEAVAKHAHMIANDMQLPDRWHFIGHLQRNKVKQLAPFVRLWQSVDSAPLVHEIAKYAPRADVLIEVNLSGAKGRSGCMWPDLETLVDAARDAELNVRGLMGIGPLVEPEQSRPYFRQLAEAARRLELAEISMGMSGDLEVAVAEGATMVRVGSAFFGSRPPREQVGRLG